MTGDSTTAAASDRDGSLAGRVALVTGAGRRAGLGAGVAHAMALAGASVLVTDLAPSPPAEVGYGEGDGADAVVGDIRSAGGVAADAYGDVSDEAQAAALVEVAIDTFGRLDIVVNNAAAPHGRDRAHIADVPVEDFDRQWDVNVRGAFLMLRAACAPMRRQRWGRVINISSQAGRIGFANRGAYSASKAALIGLTRAAACDVVPDGITVNAICPGAMATPRFLQRSDADDKPDEVPSAMGRAIPVGRYGLPADIGAGAVYLASEGAGYVTGQILVIDGGIHPF